MEAKRISYAEEPSRGGKQSLLHQMDQNGFFDVSEVPSLLAFKNSTVGFKML